MKRFGSAFIAWAAIALLCGCGMGPAAVPHRSPDAHADTQRFERAKAETERQAKADADAERRAFRGKAIEH